MPGHDLIVMGGSAGGIEALRTIVTLADGEPMQRVLPAEPSGLPRIDLTGLPAGARESEALRLAAEEGGAVPVAIRPADAALRPRRRRAER